MFAVGLCVDKWFIWFPQSHLPCFSDDFLIPRTTVFNLQVKNVYSLKWPVRGRPALPSAHVDNSSGIASCCWLQSCIVAALKPFFASADFMLADFTCWFMEVRGPHMMKYQAMTLHFWMKPDLKQTSDNMFLPLFISPSFCWHFSFTLI